MGSRALGKVSTECAIWGRRYASTPSQSPQAHFFQSCISQTLPDLCLPICKLDTGFTMPMSKATRDGPFGLDLAMMEMGGI